MEIKDTFDIKINNIKYKVRLVYVSKTSAIESKLGLELKQGYYIHLTPFTIDENNEIVLHQDYRVFSMVKQIQKESEKTLEKLILNKKEIAIDTLKTEYANLKSKAIYDKIKEENERIKAKSTLGKGFESIAGYDEVKEELLEIIDYIKNPSKYRKVGATLPKGVLLYGPPGTGKTHFARALAEEADINFIYASGSEFVEKYQGVGAKRVRDLFEKARKNAPSIIFIDEIDAIGKKRNEDKNSNEKDQTLNQLLIELDGFKIDSTTILMCATNRMEFLDDALKRPGRLDKHIYIGNPDIKTRHQLFEIHTRNKPLSEDVNIEELAKSTHGYSCADIKNICNQASLFAVREDKDILSQANFENAIEASIGGLKSKSKRLSRTEKERVSYHEAGHAVVNYMLGYNKTQKVSIIPRGKSLGCVMSVSEEDKFIKTEQELLCDIMVLLAGRASEKVVFGNYSTGASNDLEKASCLAFDIVAKYGLYDEKTLFTVNSSNIPNSLFFEYKNKAEEILIECNNDVEVFLNNNRELLDKIAKELLDKEELTYDDMKKTIDGSCN